MTTKGGPEKRKRRKKKRGGGRTNRQKVSAIGCRLSKGEQTKTHEKRETQGLMSEQKS